jgi:hypothetical protein
MSNSSTPYHARQVAETTGHPVTNVARRRLAVLVGVVWMLAFYFLCRPYRGVRHDARLYFAQTQFHLTPDWMSSDLFFQNGSQDRYTIFSTLFAPVLKSFGLEFAEIGTLLILHLLFWIAAFLVVRRIQSPLRWGMLAVLAVMPHFYGPGMTFSFGEPFLTARTLAEPLCLFALAALAANRTRLALACLPLALVAHPLIAIPVWAIAWYMLCERDRRWLWAGIALAGPMIAGASGVAPFDGLFKRYDEHWFAHVYSTNNFDFLYGWSKETWAVVFFDLSLLTVAAWHPDMPLRRLLRATLVTTVVLCLVSAVLCDGLHLILPTQLQLWRSLWVAHLMALLALYPCAIALWNRSLAGRLASAALLLAAVIVYSEVKTSFVFAGVAVALALLALRGAELRPRLAIGGIAVCAAGAIIMGVLQMLEYLMLVLQHVQTGLALDEVRSIPAAIAQLMLLVAWLALIVAYRSARRWALPASLAVGVLGTAIGVNQWDQRDAVSRYVEAHYGQSNPFGVELRPNAQVYWWKDMLWTWVLLQRPAYASSANEAAAIFGRDSTLEMERRLKILIPMTIQIEGCIEIARSGLGNFKAEECRYTDNAIRDVCRTPGGPGYVVLMNALQMPPLGVWNYRTPGGRPEPYYLYDCQSF